MQGKVKSARAKYKNMTKAEKEKAGGRTKYMRKVKNDAKIVRADKNSALGAASAKGAQAQADQNKSALSGQTGNVKSAGRNQDKGDLTPAQQAAKQAALLKAAADKEASPNKMAPGFFKGKSPLKMGYFKK